jgi:arylsulfatase A-like enzyme
MNFTADHGETMMEHEIWFAHQDQVHEPIVRVSLSILVPGRRGSEVTRSVSLVDVMPNVLAVLAPDGVIRAGGVPVEAPAHLRGRSLLAQASRDAAAAARDVLVETTDFEEGLHRRALG